MLTASKSQVLIKKIVQTANQRHTSYLPHCQKFLELLVVAYGHLNFQALRKLAQRIREWELTKINQVDQVCDGCLAGK